MWKCGLRKLLVTRFHAPASRVINCPQEIRMRVLAMLPLVVVALVVASRGEAADQTLTITTGAKSQEFSTTALLSRPDAVSITVPGDVSYRRTMTYRAVPLLALLDGTNNQFDTLEARARDGFVAQIPLDLVTRGGKGGAVAWLAVEDPAHPWAALPNRTESAGPFYLVWEHPQKSAVSSEQWPFELTSLALSESPLRRWPQLVLPAAHANDASAKSGQKVFVTLCLPCHRLNGAGVGQVGPDLGQPMNATRYLSDSGLRAIIRDPKAVRTWPGQLMTGFGPKTLPDADLDALVAYLRAMADKPGSAAAATLAK
jgi:mono/diheme cytochrome c family protein